MRHSRGKSIPVNYGEIYQIKEAYHHKWIEAKSSFYTQHVEVILALVKEFGASPVLDVGCGDGYITSLLFDAITRDVIGLDISNEAIRIAKDKNKDIAFLAGSCKTLPFCSESFKTIVASELIEHLTYSDGQLLIKELKRVLKPKGRIIISTPNLSSTYLRALRLILKNKKHLKEYNKKEFNDAVSQSFKVICHFTATSLPLPLIGKLLKIPKSTQYIVGEKEGSWK